MSPESRYDRIRAAIREHPWAIVPDMLELVVEIIDRRIEGREPQPAEIDAAIEAARRSPSSAGANGGTIAVIPVYGVLAHRMHLFSNVSKSGTSAEAITLAVREAVRSPDVDSIVLDIDSPGGSVFGIQELGGAIAEAAREKPVVAVANSMAASAAYWIASQATELVVTPGGMVGSIGVLAVHDDVSERARQLGVKRTYVTAGQYKAEGNAFEPLGDEARAELQRQVDAYYDLFVRAVASGRRASLTKVRETFGQGRLVLAGDAVSRGMADREETLQQTVDRLTGRGSRAAAGSRAEASENPIAAEEEAPPATEESSAPDTSNRDRDRELLRFAETARRSGA